MKKTPKNRQEAELITTRRQQSIEVGTEDTLQASIKKAFEEKYPEKIGRLFATFQNPNGMKQHGIWIARGMVEGVSDMIFISDNFEIVPIEIKHPDKLHKRDHIICQAKWMINNSRRGGFCTSVDMFFNIIEGRSNGIDPKRVLEHMERFSTKSTIAFKDLLYL